MITLGIESTAHTFGVGIVDDSKKGKKQILSNVKDIYTTKKGGIIPSEAAEHHVVVCDGIISSALKKAGVGIKDVNLIAFSQGPGLGNTLRVGAVAARSLSIIHKIPLIRVNHCIAHLEVGNLVTESKDPVLLYVSGANTQVIAYEGGKYRVFGETLDNGAGNFLDGIAREMGIGFPGGPKIEKLAEKGRKFVELPYIVKGMDVSFGGLFTNIKHKIHSKKFRKTDLAYSAQETIFAMLLEVAERALAHCGKDELLLGGGVCCNKRLKQMARQMCRDRGAKCFIPENEFLTDNGAMIAWLGRVMYKSGCRTEIKNSSILPYERTDDVKVKWR